MGSIKSKAPIITAVLAIAAGVIHLAHNYLSMQAPAGGNSGPPPAALAAPSGLMSITTLYAWNAMGRSQVASPSAITA